MDMIVLYPDQDGDGFGDGDSIYSCFAEYHAAQDGDCDDTDSDIHPEAPEVPGDGIDQDCDMQELCYFDGDNDGFGAEAILGSWFCEGMYEASQGGDCDAD